MGLYYVIIAVILLACLLMVLVVLVQNSKGGGLASNLQGQNQYMGVRKTADFLEKTTWTLAIVIAALSLISVFVIPRGEKEAKDTELRESIEKGKIDALPVIDIEKQKEAMQNQSSETAEPPTAPAESNAPQE